MSAARFFNTATIPTGLRIAMVSAPCNRHCKQRKSEHPQTQTLHTCVYMFVYTRYVPMYVCVYIHITRTLLANNITSDTCGGISRNNPTSPTRQRTLIASDLKLVSSLNQGRPSGHSPRPTDETTKITLMMCE